MSTSTQPVNGELVQISPVEEAIRARVAEERDPGQLPRATNRWLRLVVTSVYSALQHSSELYGESGSLLSSTTTGGVSGRAGRSR